jgi:hypothetical protein
MVILQVLNVREESQCRPTVNSERFELEIKWGLVIRRRLRIFNDRSTFNLLDRYGSSLTHRLLYRSWGGFRIRHVI